MFGDSEVSTTFAAANTGVAQLVEHRSPKPGVGSSSLSSRAKEEPQVIDDFLRLFFSIKIKSIQFIQDQSENPVGMLNSHCQFA